MNSVNEILTFKIVLIYLLFIYVLSSCSEKKEEVINDEEAITILVQPFKDINSGDVAEVAKEIRKFYPKVKYLSLLIYLQKVITSQEIATGQIPLFLF